MLLGIFTNALIARLPNLIGWVSLTLGLFRLPSKSAVIRNIVYLIQNSPAIKKM